MNRELIAPYIEKKLVSEQPHPQAEHIRIYNYTQRCQFDHAWDDVTKQCRGLILNLKDETVVARPFSKFFNVGQEAGLVIPSETPIITKKYDGSLGILYFLPGDRNPHIATRGSFTSDQALWASQWVKKYLAGGLLSRNLTYLFEIVYPENRIVVNYPFSGLVLLAIRDTNTGFEWNFRNDTTLVPRLTDTPPGYGGNRGDFMRIAEAIPHTDLDSLKGMTAENEEGFVIHYPSAQLRLKIKFDEYVRLHRLVTGVSEKAIWELLKNGQSFDDLLERVPDEFYKWVDSTANGLRERFNHVFGAVASEYMELSKKLSLETNTRKEWADEIKKSKHSGLLFAMLDRRDIDEMIWKMIRPKVEQKTFKQDIDL